MNIDLTGLLIALVGILLIIGGIAIFAYKPLIATAIGGIAMAVLGLATFTIHPIQAGYVGVVTSFGKVQPDTLKPGLNFIVPILNNVTDVDTRVQAIHFGDDPNNKFGAASKEYQDVFMVGTINLHIDQTHAVDLYQNVGLDYAGKIVVPFFANAIKEVVPKYSVGEVLANRENIRNEALQKLKDKLVGYGLVVDDIAISNIDFSDQYKQAVEQKQVQEQQVQTEQQVLAQKQIQAQEAKVTAQGAADARVAQAQGNAQAAIIEANAQAQVNQTLAKSITPELIQYQYVNKLSPSIQTMILPSGQQFILNSGIGTTPSAAPSTAP